MQSTGVRPGTGSRRTLRTCGSAGQDRKRTGRRRPRRWSGRLPGTPPRCPRGLRCRPPARAQRRRAVAPPGRPRERPGGEHAGHDRGGRRAEPEAVRNRVHAAQRDPWRLPASASNAARMARTTRWPSPYPAVASPTRCTSIRKPVVGHLGVHLVVQAQRQAERVEARPEVGAGGRAPAPTTACSATGSLSRSVIGSGQAERGRGRVGIDGDDRWLWQPGHRGVGVLQRRCR